MVKILYHCRTDGLHVNVTYTYTSYGKTCFYFVTFFSTK